MHNSKVSPFAYKPEVCGDGIDNDWDGLLDYADIDDCNTTTSENDINQTPQDTPVAGNVLTNDSDDQGDTQTVSSASGNPITIPVNGTPTPIYDANSTDIIQYSMVLIVFS